MNKVIYLSFLFFSFLSFNLPSSANLKVFIGILFLLIDIILACNRDLNCLKKYSLFYFLFVCYGSASAFWSLNTKLTLYSLFVSMIPLILVMISVILFCKNIADFKNILRVFYITSIIVIVFLLRYIDFRNLEGSRLFLYSDDEFLDGINSNYIAGYLVYSIYAGYVLYWNSVKSALVKIIYLFITIGMVFIILLSGSRTSLLLLIIPIFIYNMIGRKSKYIRFFIYSLIGILILYFLIMNIPVLYSNIGSRFGDAFDVLLGEADGTEDVSRKYLIMYGLEWFLDRPFFGYGLNCFRVLSNETYLFSGKNFYAHNNYIELLVDIGIVGVIIYYSIYVFLLKMANRMCFCQNKNILYSVMCCLIVSDLFWVSYYNILSQFLLCIAFLLIYLYDKKFLNL